MQLLLPYFLSDFDDFLPDCRTIFEAENIDDNLLADIRQNNDSADLNCIISCEEVRQSIAHLHANKSPGPDGLPAEFF